MGSPKFSKVFKLAVVKLSFESDKSVAEVAKENKVGESTLFNWRREYGDIVKKAIDNNESNYLIKCKDIEKELEIVRNENNYLKNINKRLAEKVDNYKQALNSIIN